MEPKDGSEGLEPNLSARESFDRRWLREQRSLIQEALLKGEEQLQALLDDYAVAIYLKDLQGRYLTINRPCEVMFRSTREWVAGKTDHEIFPKQMADAFRVNDRQALEADSLREFEEYFLREDVEYTSTTIKFPLYDSAGSVYALCGISTGITGRGASERSSREVEASYRALVEGLPELICRFLPEGMTLTWVNEAYCRYFGKSREELIGNSFLQLLSEEDREPIKEAILSLDRENPEGTFEQRVLRADGEARWQQWTNRAVYDEKGNFVEYQAVGRDFNVWKLAEEALRESEERFRNLTDAAFEGIAIIENGEILETNRAYADMFGYELSEVSGMSVLDLHPPEAREEVRQKISSGYGEPYESKGLRKDGTTFDIEIRGKTVSYKDRSVRVTAIRDVTERKRTEEALKKSEERFRSLIQNSSDIITVVDAEGTILYQSPSIERTLGYKPEERIGKNALKASLIHPEDIAAKNDAATEAARNPGASVTTEIRMQHRDGSWRYVEETITSLLDDPNVGGIVFNARDITERKRAEEALRNSEANLAEAQRLAHLGSWEWDVVANEISWSDEIYRICGFSPGEFVPTFDGFMELVHPDDRERVRKAIDGALYENDPCDLHHRVIRPDGEVHVVHCRARVIFGEGGEPLRMIGTMHDITQRERTQEEMRESEERYRAVVEQSVESIFLFDPDTKRILESNTALQSLLGYTSEELFEMTVYDLVAHERDEIDSDIQRDLLEKRRFAGERKYRRKDGSLVDVEVSMTVIPYYGREVLCHLARDITERKALEEQLRHQAFHDSLTGLPNRALFLDRLQHALARSGRLREPVAVLLIDLDDFKVVNDSLGHDAGNLLLVRVGERLRDSVRLGDTVARLFGDEFALLLEAPAGVEEASRVAERIEERFQAAFDLDGQEAFVTPSIGIASGESAGDQPEEVLRHADLAMYTAKRRGKARYEVYNPAMKTRAVKRMDLESELRRAIEREEFEVYYQPIVELRTGRIGGVEALARWRHPERGLVVAAEFIRLAEEISLIGPIGLRIVEEACRRAKEWRERYPERELLMSVNFSMSQLIHQMDLIPEILRDTGLEPSALQLEITGRIVTDDAELSLRKLRRLKSLGMSFAIDDYGMGYSCLYYVKHMPVDSLKIDRAFVAGLGEDPGNAAIVSVTIDLAHTLGLKIVAEGVESADQLAKLEEMGCDLAQGFYLAEPLSEEAMSVLLADGYHR